MSIPSMEEAARARRQRLLDRDQEKSVQNETLSNITSTPSFKRPLPKSASTSSKNIIENNSTSTTDTVEGQATQLLEELSKSGILGEGMGKKRLTIDELSPKDVNADLKKMLTEKSKKLEEATKEAIDELIRQDFAQRIDKE